MCLATVQKESGQYRNFENGQPVSMWMGIK